uniref:Uncharacterized protein n=1 Tax=Heliothis virescens TaxID=7102 RepID=A0A2A4KAD9_HELVI
MFFVWTLIIICLNCVFGDLNLKEGGLGTCLKVYKCPMENFIMNWLNAGYVPGLVDIPEMPDICSLENNEPVICCTGCYVNINATKPRNPSRIGPTGHLEDPGPTVASRKCLDYFSRLPYKCRGGALGLKIVKTVKWYQDKPCHMLEYSGWMATGGRMAERFEFPHSLVTENKRDHYEKSSDESKDESEVSNISSCVSNTKSEAILPTALVKSETTKGSYITLRCLVDLGSQASCIPESAAHLLALKRYNLQQCHTRSGSGDARRLTASLMVRS